MKRATSLQVAIAALMASAVLTGCGAEPTPSAPEPTPPTSASTATTPSPAPAPSPTASRSEELVLTATGLGGVALGSTLDEFAETFGRPVVPMTATDESVFTDHRCVVRRLAGLRGVGFMVIGDDAAGVVRRIGVEGGSDVRTETGIELGSSLDDVRAAHGDGLDEPFDHYPVGGDAVLTEASPGAGSYLVFVGDESDRVVEFRLGYRPEVLNSEGCV